MKLQSLFQVEQPRDLARDSGQRKLTYSLQNHCASSRSVYLSRRLDSHWDKFAVIRHLKEVGVFSTEINFRRQIALIAAWFSSTEKPRKPFGSGASYAWTQCTVRYTLYNLLQFSALSSIPLTLHHAVASRHMDFKNVFAHASMAHTFIANLHGSE